MAVPIALTIAGSDSGGGAGIQADIKTLSALGVYAASVITALTAQNTRKVQSIFPVSPDFIQDQIHTVFEDLDIRAIKIGMLGDTTVIEAVATALKLYPSVSIVLDPVMVAKSGDKLLQPDAIDSLREQLLPLATILTPNLPEAAVLAGQNEPRNLVEMKDLLEKLMQPNGPAILLKGGHLAGASSDDLFFDGQETICLASPRIETRNSHGTGCTLSAAIAAGLAKNLSLYEAVTTAKEYLTKALQGADSLSVGKGHGPVHHFHAFWESPGK
ncbi:bifunctional hydroxymethylpyrimidine kinase/phosphomethylpyrimidine kinase [Kiloniella laminariae]|uniref:bifunctional hydroxymethylpyrimidine kinase/phosphomethylpyrimidine kinase n=1 Tax=Kiloniella laminariae TaxID=454162 RepID=UPI0003646BE6|nr:bifunctional hydroxymethylpyrimidine kinase/phosphomethylpyrimidine kinase [Kiloniella laminariae]